MLSKVFSLQDILEHIHDGQTIMFGDWHGQFAADEIIDGMLEKGVKDIKAILPLSHQQVSVIVSQTLLLPFNTVLYLLVLIISRHL